MNPRIFQIQTSMIRQIAAKKRATSIDLGLGEPSLEPQAAHLDAAMTYVREHGIRYTANAGDPVLREAIAAYYAYPGMESAQSVCVTTGSQEALYVTIKTLLDPAKDELLVVEPAFPSFVKVAQLEGIAVRTVAMREADGFAYDADAIAAALGPRTRAILICSPCNPTARVIREGEARKLIATLRARSGEPVWLLHDEIYREQTFVSDAAEIARLYEHTVVTNSLSKSNALTGLRLGWLIGPPAFVEGAIKCHAWLTSCTNTFAQAVARDIFAPPCAVREYADWYATRVPQVESALREAGLQALPIDGSFYACVRLPGTMPSLEAAMELVEKHDVVAIPGIAFGASFEHWLRLSWVAPLDQLREGLQRIASFGGLSGGRRGRSAEMG
jgi:aspartate/methionine/tyrosine aminotransferase